MIHVVISGGSNIHIEVPIPARAMNESSNVFFHQIVNSGHIRWITQTCCTYCMN